jgi:hypothetical protein
MYARIARFLLVAVTVTLLAGCSSLIGKKPEVPRETYHPKYTPRNVSGVPTLPEHIRRVVVLPVYWERDAGSDFVDDMDSILQLSLQRTNSFEVVPISRTQTYKLFSVNQFSSVSILPDDLLPILAKTYAADGVLFIDMTLFRPYRPIAIGLRAKLVDAKSGKIIWAIDCLFDSADPAVARAALDFSSSSTYNATTSVDSTGSILLSPRAFAAFASDTMFGTLPHR